MYVWLENRPAKALGKHLVEEMLEEASRLELAGADDGRVPGQILVYFAAENAENIQVKGALLD